MFTKLNVAEEDMLKFLYIRANIPTDQYKRRPGELRKLADEFNALTERNDDPDDILHFIITQRKQKKWPTLGAGHKKLQSISPETLTSDDWRILEQIYLDMNKGSDNYAFNSDLRSELPRRFAVATGRVVAARTLCAMLEVKRKDGSLPRLTVQPPEPFADMDSIAL
jgi:hypothetical protein